MIFFNVDMINNCNNSKSLQKKVIGSSINEIASKCGSDKEQMRKESCWVMQVIVEESKFQLSCVDQISC